MDTSNKEVTSESIAKIGEIIGSVEKLGKKWYKSKILLIAVILISYTLYTSISSNSFNINSFIQAALGIVIMVFRVFSCNTKLKK